MNAAILLVEDNALLRESESYSLTQAGFQIQAAGSLVEAIECLRQSRPHLVLLDLGLPDGNGITLGHWLRAMHIPFVIITGRPRPRETQLGPSLGAEDYLVKPIGNEELASRVTSILQRVTRTTPDSPSSTFGDA